MLGLSKLPYSTSCSTRLALACPGPFPPALLRLGQSGDGANLQVDALDPRVSCTYELNLVGYPKKVAITVVHSAHILALGSIGLSGVTAGASNSVLVLDSASNIQP